MCLIVFAWKADSCHPEQQLVLAANRDEYYNRPTENAHHWGTHPDIIAGKDLKMGGTWLGINARGRMAAITNFRERVNAAPPLSRGEIPTQFLSNDMPAAEFARRLAPDKDQYGGFNCILLDGEELIYCSNRLEQFYRSIPPGIYGLSNHLLDTPWQKLHRAKQVFSDLLSDMTDDLPVHALIELMQDTRPAAEADLPNTGLPKSVEQMLSPIFIASDHYGTRCTTVISQMNNRHIQLTEQSYLENGKLGERVTLEMN